MGKGWRSNSILLESRLIPYTWIWQRWQHEPGPRSSSRPDCMTLVEQPNSHTLSTLTAPSLPVHASSLSTSVQISFFPPPPRSSTAKSLSPPTPTAARTYTLAQSAQRLHLTPERSRAIHIAARSPPPLVLRQANLQIPALPRPARDQHLQTFTTQQHTARDFLENLIREAQALAPRKPNAAESTAGSQPTQNLQLLQFYQRLAIRISRTSKALGGTPKHFSRLTRPYKAENIATLGHFSTKPTSRALRKPTAHTATPAPPAYRPPRGISGPTAPHGRRPESHLQSSTRSSSSSTL